MKVRVFVILSVFLLTLIGCSQQKTNKLGELYVATITQASDWEAKPTFLAITEDSFTDMDENTKDWILTKLEEKFEDIYVYEEIKNDEDKFKFESINGRKTLVKVINGMIIDVEVKQYEKTKATVTVSAKKGKKAGIIPTYSASYKNGDWQVEKKGQAEI